LRAITDATLKDQVNTPLALVSGDNDENDGLGFPLCATGQGKKQKKNPQLVIKKRRRNTTACEVVEFWLGGSFFF
jgi:hypothetical protein